MIYPRKKSAIDPYLLVFHNIFKNKFVDRRCPSGYCKNDFETWLSILVKKFYYTISEN